jgi:hypothetical protein
MGEDPRRDEERRSHRRVELTATAIVLHREQPVGRFVVQNLSASGALLTGSHPVAQGKRVRVLLSFPDQRMVAVSGRVVRQCDAMGHVVSLAVAFRHCPAATQDLIQQEALTALLRAGKPSVVVLADRPEVRRRLAHEVEALGRAARLAATPLDAVRWLEDPGERIDTVVVARSMGAPGAYALLGFFAEEYPRVRRLLVQDGPTTVAATRPDDLEAGAPGADAALTRLLS